MRGADGVSTPGDLVENVSDRECGVSDGLGFLDGRFFGSYVCPVAASLRSRSSASSFVGRPRFLRLSTPNSGANGRNMVKASPLVVEGRGESVIRGGRG